MTMLAQACHDRQSIESSLLCFLNSTMVYEIHQQHYLFTLADVPPLSWFNR